MKHTKTIWRTLPTLLLGCLPSVASCQNSLPAQASRIVQQLRSADPAGRDAGLKALQENREAGVVISVVSATVPEADQELSSHLIAALARFDDPRKVGPLLELAEKFNDRFSGEVAEQLINLGDRALPELRRILHGSGVGRQRLLLGVMAMLAIRHPTDSTGSQAKQGIFAALSDPSPQIRGAAIETISFLVGEYEEAGKHFTYDEALLPLLKIAQSDEDPRLRRAAIELLPGINDGRVKPALRAALTDPEEAVRISARSSLDYMLPPEDPKALYSPDPIRRVEEAEALGKSDRVQDSQLLLQLLKDPNERVRLASVTSLLELANRHRSELFGQNGDRDIQRIIPLLLSAFQDTSPMVRQAAVEAIGATFDQIYGNSLVVPTNAAAALRPLLDDKDPKVLSSAVKAAGQLRARDLIPNIVPLLQSHERDVVRAAIVALGEIRDPVTVGDLVPRLKDPDPEVRALVAHALSEKFDWRFKDSAAVEPLIAALQDDAARGDAIVALGKLGDSRAVMPLVAVLNRPDGVRDECSACIALGLLRDSRAVEPLLEHLHDRSSSVRRNVVEALSHMESPKVPPALVEALQDPDEGVRFQVALSLGGEKFHDPRSVTALVSALQDPSTEVRRIAASSLGFHNDRRAVEPLIATVKTIPAVPRGHAQLDEGNDPQLSAARSLGLLGDQRAVEPLIVLLAQENLRDKHLVIEALGRLGDPQAVEPMIKIVVDPKQKTEVRCMAAWALGNIGDARAIKALQTLISPEPEKESDKNLIAAAKDALKRLAQPTWINH